MKNKVLKYIGVFLAVSIVFSFIFGGDEEPEQPQIVQDSSESDESQEVQDSEEPIDAPQLDLVGESDVAVPVNGSTLFGNWFKNHDYLVLIIETLSDGQDSSFKRRELSADCEVAIQQDLQEKELNEFFARAGTKIHVYLASGDAKSFVELKQHPNCVAAFGGASSGPQLCNELEKTMAARVVVDDSGVPISYTSNWVQWNIDASGFSDDNRVVALNASKDGQALETYAYVCGYN